MQYEARRSDGEGRREDVGGRKAASMVSLPREQGSLATRRFERFLKAINRFQY